VRRGRAPPVQHCMARAAAAAAPCLARLQPPRQAVTRMLPSQRGDRPVQAEARPCSLE